MSSGALFPSLVSGSRGSSSKYLVEFRAGKMTLKGNIVMPDKRKGMVYIQQSDDSLIHFCWKDRTTGNVDDDLIIFPDDCEFKRVNQCTTGRVYVLKFKAGSKRLFFWMQEPKTDKDEEYCRKVNEFLNNPPIPGAPGSGGGGHELSALGGEGGLQNLLGNMSHNQLMQLIGPTGLGGLGLGALAGPGLANLLGSGGPATSSSSSSSRSQSTAATPSSGSAPRLSSSQTPSTPAAPAASTTSSSSSTAAPAAPAATQTPAIPASAGSPSAHQPIQLSDLQSILATMNVPAAGAAAAQGSAVDLTSVCTPEMMAPILTNAEVQQRLLPFLPSGESLLQSGQEIQDTLNSPQFQQSMSMFSSALASGQLGPLMSQFGLPADAVDAANKGDVEAFARAMQGSKDAKDKKKDDEDDNMTLD
ncbi:proteasomal ubiquitin receptor ADRM1-like isoform X1 [Salarias fasciatus]|uniref:proteasomal ubiquitin receptor ADRM1-like isoform X1 n=1 Tax=Salarias fasciatus TaxID=181472 RepID=UPI001176AB4C|nr:proteasomal ubiquitin receptor ADRM1-like isoform X1 [Salarias fasciatus]XP_029974652.1 proteasomal ubiquitin receptor ADRM1-like isoform X1 [Salarias fasciatus]